MAIGTPITLDSLNALAALANGKTSIQDYLDYWADPDFAFGSGGWLAEFNRLRDAVQGALINTLEGHAQYISGPWPITNLNSDSLAGLWRGIRFVYPDTGEEESLTVVGQRAFNSEDPDAESIYGEESVLNFYSVHCKIRIGGNRPVRFTGIIYFLIDSYSGMATATASTDMPGVGAAEDSVTAGSSPPGFWKFWRVDNLEVDPGEYNFYCTASGPDPADSIHYALVSGASLGAINEDGTFSGTRGKAKIEITSSVSEAYPGIHSSKALKVIYGPDIDDDGVSADFPFGIYVKGYDNKWVQDAEILWTATTTGAFVGYTPPVTNLQMDQHAVMPWNIVGQYSVPGVGTFAIYRDIPNEEDTIPKPKPDWVASVPPSTPSNYNVGQIITDSNGNWQKCIVAGVAGTSAPTWGTLLLSETVDNSVRWQLIKLANQIPEPAVARCYSVPRFPWHRSTSSSSQRPESIFSRWNVFDCVGWWLYYANCNRVGPVNAKGIRVSPGGTASMQLGCMRSGAFASFTTGTHASGFIQGLWPVWTRNSLVYDCAEELDIQAAIINPERESGIIKTWGHVDFPLCAAYIDDIVAILNLLS